MIGHLVERARQARGPEARAAKRVRDAARLQRRYARESWHVFLRRQRERVERLVASPPTSPRVLEDTATTPLQECELRRP